VKPAATARLSGEVLQPGRLAALYGGAVETLVDPSGRRAFLPL